MKIIADKHIPQLAELFNHPPFELELVSELNAQTVKDADVLICRSQTKVNESLLNKSQIQCVATATSGLDHIDQAYLKQKKIHLLHAQGANAQSVCDYVEAVMANQWPHINGKLAAVIGVGHVGRLVVKLFTRLGFDILLYDPLRDEAEEDFNSVSFNELVHADVISIHTPLTRKGPYPTYHLIDEAFLKNLKTNTLLINTARGGVVDEAAILHSDKAHRYCFDVFENEPGINLALLDKLTLATPHIAGHAIEAKIKASLCVYKGMCQHFNVKAHHQEKNFLNFFEQKSTQTLAQILQLYDPAIESKALKKIKKPQDFLLLRRAHHHRHEFRCPV